MVVSSVAAEASSNTYEIVIQGEVSQENIAHFEQRIESYDALLISEAFAYVEDVYDDSNLTQLPGSDVRFREILAGSRLSDSPDDALDCCAQKAPFNKFEIGYVGKWERHLSPEDPSQGCAFRNVIASPVGPNVRTFFETLAFR